MADSASGGTGVLVAREAVVTELTFRGDAVGAGSVTLSDGAALRWGLNTSAVNRSATVRLHGLQFSTNVTAAVVNGTAYIEYI